MTFQNGDIPFPLKETGWVKWSNCYQFIRADIKVLVFIATWRNFNEYFAYCIKDSHRRYRLLALNQYYHFYLSGLYTNPLVLSERSECFAFSFEFIYSSNFNILSYNFCFFSFININLENLCLILTNDYYEFQSSIIQLNTPNRKYNLWYWTNSCIFCNSLRFTRSKKPAPLFECNMQDTFVSKRMYDKKHVLRLNFNNGNNYYFISETH